MKQIAEMSACMRRPQAVADTQTQRDRDVLGSRIGGSGVQPIVRVQERALLSAAGVSALMRRNGRRTFSTFTLKLCLFEPVI
jgi:hypothetical protein